jgi:hypothetical protein
VVLAFISEMVVWEKTHKWGYIPTLYLIIMLNIGTGTVTLGYRYRYFLYQMLEQNLNILTPVTTQGMDWRTGSLGGEVSGKEESLINLEGSMAADHNHRRRSPRSSQYPQHTTVCKIRSMLKIRE